MAAEVTHQGDQPPSATAHAPAPKPPKPISQVVITGVVQAVDPAANQITITYEAVDELNWPRGTMPFSAYKPELLKGVTVGERVHFKLDSQQITELTPY
jgi:Cu/Ag efflux protein CusF